MTTDDQLFDADTRAAGRRYWAERAERSRELAARAAVRRRELAERGRAMTGAERVARHRSGLSDTGEIPPVRHRRVRESCRLDLLRFGMTYCRRLLDHEPSDDIISGLVLPLQRLVIHGGQDVVLYPRSAGKTTWSKIAVIWALLYGFKKYVVVVCATRLHSDEMLSQIVGALAASDEIAVDFPGVSLPVRMCDGNGKRANGIRTDGQPCGMRWTRGRFVLPTCSGVSEPSAGSILVCGSMRSAIKGQSNQAYRPDLVLLDDPQTRKVAESPDEVLRSERFVDGDVMGLCAQTSVMSVLMSITPIRRGDLADRYSNALLHPGWRVIRSRYVTAWTDEADEGLRQFRAAYAADAATRDNTWQLSRSWYIDHREMFAGVRVIDPLNYAPGEVDAIHHLLVLRARTTDEAFAAEYQMDVGLGDGADSVLREDDVSANLSGCDVGVLPPGTSECVAYCDVNIQRGSGLVWGIMAFGPDGVASVVAYGKWPRNGAALVRPGADHEERRAGIISGCVEVARVIRDFPLRTERGARVHVRALCFDGRYASEDVRDAVTWIGRRLQLGGMRVLRSYGYAWSQWSPRVVIPERDRRHETVIYRDHVRVHVYTDADGRETGRLMDIHTDYWREIAQSELRRRWPRAHSCSLWGSSALRHHEFAEQVCYERLVRTWTDPKKGAAWEWDNIRRGHNHYGDVVVGCFALARMEDIFTARPRDPLRSLAAMHAPADTRPAETLPVEAGVVVARARLAASRPAARRIVFPRLSMIRR